MRVRGIDQAYEQLKTLTRGKQVDADSMNAFIDTLALPEDDKTRLKAMQPGDYVGNAPAQAQRAADAVQD